MGRIVMWPYKMNSKSSRVLARNLGIMRVYSHRNYRPRSTDTVINWGNSGNPSWDIGVPKIINQPYSVGLSVDKIRTFGTLEDCLVPSLDYTSNTERVQYWLDQGSKVVCRGTTTGRGGRGIVIIESGSPIPVVPLYTKLLENTNEYRVHVYLRPDDTYEIIDYTLKKKKNGVESHPYIKSHGNGWVFCRGGVVLSDEARVIAVRTTKALGLDFCAVDIAHDLDNDTYCVIEANTACGIMGTTLARYTQVFTEMLFDNA